MPLGATQEVAALVERIDAQVEGERAVARAQRLSAQERAQLLRLTLEASPVPVGALIYDSGLRVQEVYGLEAAWELPDAGRGLIGRSLWEALADHAEELAPLWARGLRERVEWVGVYVGARWRSRAEPSPGGHGLLVFWREAEAEGGEEGDGE